MILTLSTPSVNLLSLSIFQPPPEAIRPLPDVPAGRTFRSGDAQFDRVGAPRPWPYRRDPVPWLLPSLLKGSFQSQRPLEADALSFRTTRRLAWHQQYRGRRNTTHYHTARCEGQRAGGTGKRENTGGFYLVALHNRKGSGQASSVWRRRAGSNRCIAVLQTAPLTTWVRRPAHIIAGLLLISQCIGWKMRMER